VDNAVKGHKDVYFKNLTGHIYNVSTRQVDYMQYHLKLNLLKDK